MLEYYTVFFRRDFEEFTDLTNINTFSSECITILNFKALKLYDLTENNIFVDIQRLFFFFFFLIYRPNSLFFTKVSVVNV